jgi:hypothetical protein
MGHMLMQSFFLYYNILQESRSLIFKKLHDFKRKRTWIYIFQHANEHWKVTPELHPLNVLPLLMPEKIPRNANLVYPSLKPKDIFNMSR